MRPGGPAWAELILAVQLLLFMGATCAAAGHVINAVQRRSWTELNVVGIVLYAAWWIELLIAGGYLGGLAH